MLRGAGLPRLGTFRASGNVIFAAEAAAEPRDEDDRADRSGAAGLAGLRGAGLPAHGKRGQGDRRAPALRRSLITDSQGKLQVVMLSAKPAAKARKDVLALASDEDGLRVWRS